MTGSRRRDQGTRTRSGSSGDRGRGWCHERRCRMGARCCRSLELGRHRLCGWRGAGRWRLSCLPCRRQAGHSRRLECALNESCDGNPCGLAALLGMDGECRGKGHRELLGDESGACQFCWHAHPCRRFSKCCNRLDLDLVGLLSGGLGVRESGPYFCWHAWYEDRRIDLGLECCRSGAPWGHFRS